MLEMKESEDVCLCIHCKNETIKKISIHFDNNNTASFSLCDKCLTKLTKEFINYYINTKELDEIIKNHKHWIKQDCEGWKDMKADLSGANLSRTIVKGTKLMPIKKTNIER